MKLAPLWLASTGLASVALAQQPEIRLPPTAEAAVAQRAQIDDQLAELTAQEKPPADLVEALRGQAAGYTEAEQLHLEVAQQQEALETRASRQKAAQRMIDSPQAPEVDSVDPSGRPSLEALDAANDQVAAELELQRRRLADLQVSLGGGLAERRQAMERRLVELESRAAELADAWAGRGSRGLTGLPLQTLEARLESAELGVEVAHAWLSHFERRSDFLPGEIDTVALTVGALEAQLAAGSMALESARAAERLALEREASQRSQEVERALQEAESAENEWERALAAWRAETAQIEAERATTESVLAEAQGVSPLKDAIDASKARQSEVAALYARQRDADLDTAPLLSRSLGQVADARRRHLALGQQRKLVEQRAATSGALERVWRDRYFLDENWDLAIGQAREAWQRAGMPDGGEDNGWAVQAQPAWNAALQERREALTSEIAVLQRLNGLLVERLGRIRTLEETLDRESRWLERRSLGLRIEFPNPIRALEVAGRDLASWQSAGGSSRWLGLGVFALLVAVWVFITRGVRDWLRRRATSDTPENRPPLIWRAWITVAANALWVPLAAFAGVGAVLLLDAQREEEALQSVSLLAVGVLLVRALVRGLLVIAPEEAARRFRRLALLATSAVLLLGLPYHFFLAINYESSNPDGVVLLGRAFRTALCIVLFLGLMARDSIALLLGKVRISRTLNGVRLLLSVALLVIVASDWIGYDRLAAWLLSAVFGTAITIVLAWAGGRSALGALRRGIDPLVGANSLADERRLFLLTTLRFLVRAALLVGVVSGFAAAFGLAWSDLQEWGQTRLWPLGSQLDAGAAGLTVSSLSSALVVMLATFGLAHVVRGVLNFYVLALAGMERGLRFSLSTVVYYVGIFLGAFLALSAAGLKLDELQWFLAAAGVGIGFGLTEIVSNFVSGVIILFERPLKVGDWVSTGDLSGEVVDVSIRSTTLRTLQNHFVLVPNKEIITQRLVNLTGDDPKIRLDFKIGVAYGSDLALVREDLLNAAKAVHEVYRRPAPEVVFTGHGDSSLDMELRAWCHVLNRQRVLSALRFEVDAAFRKSGVSIPFPQRDLHIKTGLHPEDGGGEDGPSEDAKS